MSLEQRLIDKEKAKIETSLDEKYAPLISKPAPWGTIAKIKLQQSKESLDIKITFHKKNIIWCCILLAISLGLYIYVPCICNVLCKTYDFNEALFLIFLVPPISLATTLPLIIAIILTIIGIRKGKGIIELSHSHSSVDYVEADYFEIPHEKFSDDMHRTLLALVDGANQKNIVWGETTAGEAFNNYVDERVKSIEKEKKRLERLKRQSQLMYSIETINYADEIKPAQPIIVQVQAPEPKKETPLSAITKTAYAGTNGDFSLCIGCKRSSYCRRKNCSGFVPQE